MKFFITAVIMVLIIIASYLADRRYPQKRMYIIPCGTNPSVFCRRFHFMDDTVVHLADFRRTAHCHFKRTAVFYHLVQSA